MLRLLICAFFVVFQLFVSAAPSMAEVAAPVGARGVGMVSAAPGKPPVFRSGQWRAVLERADGNNIAFNFEVKDSAGKKVLYIRNAGERLLVDDISREGDSVIIRLPFYESQLRAVVTKDGDLKGVWLRHLVDNYQAVPFKAFYGEAFRFEGGAAATGVSVAGRWAAVFRSTSRKDTTFRVGEFQQQGSRVTGTFLDAGGDLRYLEGVVSGDSLKLSCFDGTHAYFFTAKIDGNKLSGGEYFAGPTAHEVWTAEKDENAKLEDQFAMTKWRKDVPFTFSFKDINGNKVSLSEPRFKGKVVLVQIMGSWCPNCMDETRFLSGFYDEYHSKGVEIVALAYERSTDFARSQTSLRSFQRRFQVKYPMLITGVTVGDPQRAEKTLPQLEQIVNFPTTIFVDKAGRIARIHTGFSGPGTGAHYEDQKKEIYATVNELLGQAIN
ncbi:MAG TPA: TlpA disulfide reductase family protein [Puia sp.]|jgi:thiol-disulfide isomerase/thioredoxin